MPHFMLAFHDDRDTGALEPATRAALFEAFTAWADDLHARGLYRGSEALHPSSEGRTVRKRGETMVLEGPFAETNEALNGFIMVEAASIEAAGKIAEECPALVRGWAVEVRQVVDIVKPG